MWHALHLLLRHLPCPNIHPTINLARISIDHFAIIFLCKLYRERSLPTRRRSIYHEEFGFIRFFIKPCLNVLHILSLLKIVSRCIEDIFVRKVRFINHPVEIISRYVGPKRAFVFTKFAHIENRWMR